MGGNEQASHAPYGALDLEPDLEGNHVPQSLDIDLLHCPPCYPPRPPRPSPQEPGTPCPPGSSFRPFVPPSSSTTGAALRRKIPRCGGVRLSCTGIAGPEADGVLGLDLDRGRRRGCVVSRGP
jgi:hypothetical protein